MVDGSAEQRDGGGPDACVPTSASAPVTPVLRRPMRGAYTGSLHAPAAMATLRPTLSWSAVTPTCGALTYQVQADDSCAPGGLDACPFGSPELDAQGITTTTYAPTQDLKVSTTPPVGAFYAWRVRACDEASRCSAWSEVRYLQVGRVREDINGDGYGDLLAGASGQIEVYLGSSQFDLSDATTTIPYQSGIPPTFVGDVNGDGYADFFGTANYTPTSGLVPTIFYGGPNLAGLSTLSLNKSAGSPSTIIQTTSAGDFNGDGFADLDLSIPGPYAKDFTLQQSGRIGDVNGDGEDIALTALTDGADDVGIVQIFVGGSSPSIRSAADIATTRRNYEIHSAGDVDGDGYDDVLILLPGANCALYKGAALLPSTVFEMWANTATSTAVGSFDINRDGLADFAIGTTGTTPLLYSGGTNPTVVPSGLSLLIFSTVIAVSDHDGDGRPDFVGIGSNGAGNPTIRWAGSDGTTNPQSFQVRLTDPNAMFTGFLVR
jgi:hypothetical protein